MTRRNIGRRTVGIFTAALALSVAGPAAARPSEVNSSGSLTPVTIAQPPAASSHATSIHTNGNSDLEYVLISAGGAAVALVGISGTGVASRRRRRTATHRQPTIAA